MKRCPECRRSYTDETLNYCLDDGAALVEGPASGDGESKTAIFSDALTPASPVNTSVWRKFPVRTFLVGAAAIIFVAVGGFAIYRSIRKPAVPFQSVRVTKLTNIGNATAAQISPNGEYVAHVLYENGKNSIRVWNVPTKTSIEVVPPTEDPLIVSTFSVDSRYFYYRKGPGMYEIAVFGGAPKKVLEKLPSGVGVSPDGKQIAFIRGDARGGTRLTIANADGTDERTLATRSAEGRFSYYEPSWSPDGALIACGIIVDGTNMVVAVVSTADGTVTPVTSQKWLEVSRTIWMRDGSGIIFQAASAELNHLWFASYPTGEVREITNDVNDYSSGSLSITSDSSTIVSVQVGFTSNIFVAPLADITHGRQITTGSGARGSPSSLASWTPDGRLIYWSSASGNLDIWIMNADGTGSRQLTNDPGHDGGGSMSPDGRYIVFDSTRSGQHHIWRMDADGSNPKELTSGGNDEAAHFSADGKSVIYDAIAMSTLRRVSIDGGESVPLIDERLIWPAISPKDGTIAGIYAEKDQAAKLTIFPESGRTAIKTFDLPQGGFSSPVWTPDGRSILYIITRASVSSIWSQSMDGSPAKQLADFSPEQIFRLVISPDGKSVAYSRGTGIRDVVLITDALKQQ